MLERFVDTSGWAAWADRRQQFHRLAVAGFDEVWQQNGRLITTNWVLAELTALLTSPLRIPKIQQIQLVDDIRADSGIRIIDVDTIVEASTWQLWKTRRDKDWTLIDCSSFVVMTENNLTEAVTADHHFEQAGFVRLLK